jgi:hypothetical protein
VKSILLVGEQNPHGVDPRMALWPYPEHASGGRLARILGLEVRDYLLLNDRVNLCRDAWDRAEALESARRILATRPKDSGLVMLGRKAEAAFGWVYRRYEVRYIQPGFHALALPNPSAMCREWNDSRNLDLARTAYADLRRTVGLTVSSSREGEPSDV